MQVNMASGNNTIDKFGRSKRREGRAVIIRGPPGAGFKLTADKDYDIQGKRLKNIGESVDHLDAVTRKYVDDQISAVVEKTLKSMQEVGDLLSTRVKDYIHAKNINFKEELNKTKAELMEQVRDYVDAKNTSFKEENESNLNKQLVELMGQVQAYVVDVKNTSFKEENESILNKQIDGFMEVMRAYVNQRIEEVKSLNMKENNALIEKVNKLEQIITTSQSAEKS